MSKINMVRGDEVVVTTVTDLALASLHVGNLAASLARAAERLIGVDFDLTDWPTEKAAEFKKAILAKIQGDFDAKRRKPATFEDNGKTYILDPAFVYSVSTATLKRDGRETLAVLVQTTKTGFNNAVADCKRRVEKAYKSLPEVKARRTPPDDGAETPPVMDEVVEKLIASKRTYFAKQGLTEADVKEATALMQKFLKERMMQRAH